MTSALGHIYGVLVSFIKKEIRLYKIRTTDTPEFLQDFPGGVRALIKIHDRFHEHLQQFDVEIKYLGSLAEEVSLQQVYPQCLYSLE